ncbi:replication termination protein [Fictibacillus solisalsi]|uniref:Replication termination protein n=1 Tax=Fictibacillus solisalsi TaxID=459525 RepID=A0A1H0BMT1_9BACL|nr:helix-turn-helix transcriptional regulator [Fictibacillus solisalsi]SDN46888.1 replication termination protein [Fictibacillus solisalsi]
MDGYQNRGFLLKQKAFLKLHILHKVEKKNGYGLQILDELRKEFKQFGYSPNHSDIYRILQELTKEGILRREKRLMDGNAEFQEIVVYHLTEKAPEAIVLYKKQMKVELDRCISLLNKTVHDIYG